MFAFSIELSIEKYLSIVLIFLNELLVKNTFDRKVFVIVCSLHFFKYPNYVTVLSISIRPKEVIVNLPILIYHVSIESTLFVTFKYRRAT